MYLVNARHVKGVPDKKTDVCDAQWLQHVFSDIDGLSAQAIIDAILAGERDPKKLAALHDKRCRSSAEEIIEALRGDCREEYLFVLAQSQRTYRQLREAIAACDEKLGELVDRVECEVSVSLPEAPKGQRNVGKNSPQLSVFETAWRFYGVDLGGVPGITAGLLCALISEVGTREQLLEAFPTPERFASWMGLCPDNRISGGKVLKAKTRKVKSRLAGAFRLGVFGLQRSQTEMGGYLRRIKGKLGKADGTTAAGDLDELVEQHAPSHLACHPRVSAAHLFGVRFNEATRRTGAIRKNVARGGGARIDWRPTAVFD